MIGVRNRTDSDQRRSDQLTHADGDDPVRSVQHDSRETVEKVSLESAGKRSLSVRRESCFANSIVSRGEKASFQVRMKRRDCRVEGVRKAREGRKIGKSRVKKQAWVMRAIDGKHNASDEKTKIVISQRHYEREDDSQYWTTPFCLGPPMLPHHPI